MSVLVEVTQDDIHMGQRGDCSACPIALALNRRTNRKWNVGRLYASLADGKWSIDTPDEVRDFVDAFDYRNPVTPFSFWFPTVPHYAQEPK